MSSAAVSSVLNQKASQQKAEQDKRGAEHRKVKRRSIVNQPLNKVAADTDNSEEEEKPERSDDCQNVAPPNSLRNKVFFKKVYIACYLNTDLDDEMIFVPSEFKMSNKERDRIYKNIDLVGKGYIGRADIENLLDNNQSATDDFMVLFDADGNGHICKEEFWQIMDKFINTNPPLNLRERIYQTFANPASSMSAKYISLIIMFLIVLSSSSFVMETVPEYNYKNADDITKEPTSHWIFWYIETVCIVAFTLEYVGRLCTVHAVRPELQMTVTLSVVNGVKVLVEAGGVDKHERDEEKPPIIPQSPYQKTVNFILDAMNIIDFIAIAPYYVGLVGAGGAGGLGFLRVLRLARVFRVFKMGKYNQGMQLFARVMINSAPAMYILIFFSLLGMVLFGSMIFFAEAGTWTVNAEFPHGAYLRQNLLDNGEEETPFSSIPASFWWVLVTSTTVGYGDMYPTTAAGKLVGTLCMISGVLVIALPITIIGANFANEYALIEEEKKAITDKKELRASRERAWAEGRYEELISQGVIGPSDVPIDVRLRWQAEGLLDEEEFAQFKVTVPTGEEEEEGRGNSSGGISKGGPMAAMAVASLSINRLSKQVEPRGKKLISGMTESNTLSQGTQLVITREVTSFLKSVEKDGRCPWGGRAEMTMSTVLNCLASEPAVAAAPIRKAFLEMIMCDQSAPSLTLPAPAQLGTSLSPVQTRRDPLPNTRELEPGNLPPPAAAAAAATPGQEVELAQTT